MTPVGAEPRRRLDDVDVLRGMAILAVLVLHAGIMTSGLEDHQVLGVAIRRLSTGIQLFFVISGFLITASLDRCLANGEGVGGFLIRRGAKILPLYLIFLHLNILVFWLVSSYAPQVAPFRNSPTAESLNWGNYLLHVAFLQGFVPARLHTLLDGSWSIVIEVYFYLLFGLLLAAWCRSASACAWTYAGTLLAALAFVLLIGRHFSEYSHYGFPAQLPCFIIGVAARRLSQSPDFDARFEAWRKPVAAASILLMIGLVKGESKPLGDSNVYGLLFGAVLLSASAVTDALPRRAVSALAAMGRQSYALFFVHLVLLKLAYVVLTANQVALDFWTSFALNLVVAVPASWLLAWLVFDRIDRHFVRLGSRSLSRRHNSLDWSRV